MSFLQNIADFLINRCIRDLPQSAKITISMVLFTIAAVYMYYFVKSIKTGTAKPGSTSGAVKAKYSYAVMAVIMAALSSLYIFIK